ncbi:hypothetical protein POM88_012825 [Heracleum sosnowskyi]|uniref:NAC domain-containing protein n=1 Tax=Heracleum sosnowskyi TaxID=360622 RepID=A0AAD8N246_9APIA|nr:hypothetical protein POM88_012825 [Heracleum sosnowskyi]
MFSSIGLHHAVFLNKTSLRKVYSGCCLIIDEFIPTLDTENGICYTHPENLPGKTKPVLENGTEKGSKKIMVLYRSAIRGSKSGKSNWVMHQYHLGTEEDEKDVNVIESFIAIFRFNSSGSSTSVPSSLALTWIDCPMALRNLLAIMRMFWPDGCVGALEIDRKSPGFWNKCINEFLRYYTYDPRFGTEDEARASIRAHTRDNLRRTLSDDKERADWKIAGTSGTTYADHRPLYMKPGVWSRLAEYWVSEEFKKKSAAGKKAREAVKAPHTSGARSFDRRRRGKAPTDADDLDDGGGNGDTTESDSDRDMSAPPYDIVSRGGPVIRG